MKRISMSKILAVVSMLLGSAQPAISQTAPAAPASAAPGYPSTDPKPQILQSSMESCIAAINKIQESHSKFISECTASGTGRTLKDCSEKLKECEEQGEEEEPLDVNYFMSSFGIQAPQVASSRCSQYGYSDWKTDLRDLKTTQRDAEKDLRELEKDQGTDEEKYTENKKKIQEAFVQQQKDNEKAKYDAQEEERSIETQKQKTVNDLKKELRETQMAVLRAQNTKMLLISQRAGQVEDYKLQLLECKSKTEEYASKLKSNTASSLARAQNKGGGKTQSIQTFYGVCVKKVLSSRSDQAEAYKGKLVEMDTELTNANDRIKEIQGSLTTLAQQAAQATQDRAIKRQKDQEAFEKEQFQKYQEMVELDQQMTQKRAKNMQAISKAQFKVNEESNNLDQHRSEKPRSKGNKSVNDAQAALEIKNTTKCSFVCDSISIPQTILNDNKDAQSKVTNLQNRCRDLENPKDGSKASKTGATK
ncbi:MAG: hypothetical protein ACAH59_10675 [Pseudobdellovibrionaceae bacterium]